MLKKTIAFPESYGPWKIIEPIETARPRYFLFVFMKETQKQETNRRAKKKGKKGKNENFVIPTLLEGKQKQNFVRFFHHSQNNKNNQNRARIDL